MPVAAANLEAAFRAVMPEDPPPKGTPWLWRGTLHKHGYGVFTHRGRAYLAHRVSYELFVGPIPVGLRVRHNNDTPQDINPHHLLTGTALQNSQDMVSRNRQARGAGLPHSKLTEEKVIHARALHRDGEDVLDLAIYFGVSPVTMAYAIAGLTWRHVT